MISLLLPSRGRPHKSFENYKNWRSKAVGLRDIEVILSIDDDDSLGREYKDLYNSFMYPYKLLVSKNRSAVDAINNAVKIATGNIFAVVSDDTECIDFWDEKIYLTTQGREDWILKTQDGIQPWIITMPVMDRAYYNRTGYIYHPDFEHMFCDTYLTCVADVTGRKITSNLLFPHLNDSIKDDLRKRTDGTWKQGQETFIRLMKEFSPADRAKITDPAMKNWLRNHGVR